MESQRIRPECLGDIRVTPALTKAFVWVSSGLKFVFELRFVTSLGLLPACNIPACTLEAIRGEHSMEAIGYGLGNLNLSEYYLHAFYIV